MRRALWTNTGLRGRLYKGRCMKKAAGLVINFSLTFIILFISSCFFGFLSSWIDSVRVISQIPHTDGAFFSSEFLAELYMGGILVTSARTAVPVSLFIAILLALNYSVVKKIPAIISIVTIIITAGVFYTGFCIGIERVGVYGPVLTVPGSLERRQGLIVSQADTDFILLDESPKNNNGYPRVISYPDRPLLFQEASLGVNSSVLSLPLTRSVPWFIQSILVDISLTVREINNRLGQGMFSFVVFGITLIFLLASLRFLLGLSVWPFANVLIGAVAFRFVLGLVIFLQTSEVRGFLLSVSRNLIPEFLLSPVIFCVFGTLIILYTFFAFFSRRLRSIDG